MTDRIKVAAADEFSPGERRLVSVDGMPVGVFNVEGEYFAIENQCAHDGGPVCRGTVDSELVGEYSGPGERVKESFDGDPAIACPWHGWEYDLSSGEHLGDDSISITTYDTTVDDGVVYILPK